MAHVSFITLLVQFFQHLLLLFQLYIDDPQLSQL